ncbi:diphthine synthase [Halococcus saccharolyticus]|uniref:Diphthine synthase n=1 Tax=Halococcus saccharolyticus DSM 5350 TaxID=1227455 RepID=M0MRD2_9EURY|nr:diphthine synthase [Halococcus saccharolyticus]EMA47923.1 diphthine synthase [Halococcus saccharolyticus DSM 5350]
MLTFVGLGLYDERSITVEGRDALRDADRVFAEFYTSKLVGATVADLETYHDSEIEVRDRASVEQDSEPILDAAEGGEVAFVVAGDPMISTTHTDLRLRAHERDIETRVIHGTTAQAAASSLTGLQNYRFGKATTIPFAYGDGDIPQSVLDTIDTNRERGLHTLCFLDIKAAEDRYMAASTAAERLEPGLDDPLGVVVARAGSPDPIVAADRLSALAETDFGDPLHLLVIPGDLHHVERDALIGLAGAPEDLI